MCKGKKEDFTKKEKNIKRRRKQKKKGARPLLYTNRKNKINHLFTFKILTFLPRSAKFYGVSTRCG